MAATTINIGIADDHKIFTESLSKLLFGTAQYHCSFSVSDGEDLLSLLPVHQPTILILDIHLPPHNGLAMIPKIRTVSPLTSILILSMHQPEEFQLTIKAFEGDGYLLKTCGKDTLESAIQTLVHSRQKFYSPDIKWHMPNPNDGSTSVALTRREKEIIKLVSAGKSSKEIAQELFISEHTVKTHRARIREKLGVSGVGNLINKFRQIID